MSLCPGCLARFEPDPKNLKRESIKCEFCGLDMRADERKSGTQLKMMFPTNSPNTPKFSLLMVKSGLKIKDKWVTNPKSSPKGGNSEKSLYAYNYPDDDSNLSTDF